MKKCKRCENVFPLVSFYRNQHTVDKRNVYCKPCDAIIRKRNNRALVAKKLIRRAEKLLELNTREG